MFLRALMLLGLSLVLASGCTPTPQQPVKYYNSASLEGSFPNNYIGELKVSVFTVNIPKVVKKPVLISSLHPEVLAQLIKAYGADNNLNKEALKNLHSELFGQLVTKVTPPATNIDHSRLQYSKRIKLFVATLNMFPANRVQEMNIKMAARLALAPNVDNEIVYNEIPDLKIVKIDNLKPLEKLLKVGSTQQTNTNKGSGSLSLGLPIPGVSGASLSQEQTKSIVGKRNLEFEVPYLTPFWNDDEAQINMKAPFAALEVSGHYEFDIYFKLPFPNETNSPTTDIKVHLIFNIGEDNDGTGKIEAKLDRSSYPLHPKNIYLEIKWDYIFRQVFDGAKPSANGAKTIDESDDKAIYVFKNGDDLHPVVSSACEQVLTVYKISLKKDSSSAMESLLWKSVKYKGATFNVEIEAPQKAIQFRDWLEKSKGKTGTKDGGVFKLGELKGSSIRVDSLNWSTVEIFIERVTVNPATEVQCF